MAPKSNNQKKAEALAAGKAPKKTKQQENAGQVCNLILSLSQSNLSSLVCQAEEGGDEEQEEGRCREEVRMVELLRERHAGKT